MSLATLNMAAWLFCATVIAWIFGASALGYTVTVNQWIAYGSVAVATVAATVSVVRGMRA